MCMNGISNSFVNIEVCSGCVPSVSTVTVTNLVNLFQKCLAFMKEFTIQGCHYFTHLDPKSFVRALDNIIIGVYDCFNKKDLNQAPVLDVPVLDVPVLDVPLIQKEIPLPEKIKFPVFPVEEVKIDKEAFLISPILSIPSIPSFPSFPSIPSIPSIPSSNRCFHSPYNIKFENKNELDLFKEKAKNVGIPESSIKELENFIIHLKLTRDEIFSFGELHPEIQKYFHEISWYKSPYQQSVNEFQTKEVEDLLKEAEISRSAEFSNTETIQDDWHHLVHLTHRERLSYIFSNYRGLFFGEMHNEPFSKQFLIDHMGHLKDCGVDALFIELLTYDGLQPILDQYFNHENEPMSPILKSVLKVLDSEHQLTGNATYTKLIKAAKKAKIKVICIETSLSRNCGALEGFTPYAMTSSMYKRILGMNYISQQIMQLHLPKENRKFIALMGSYHAPSSTYGQKPTIPGLAPLMKVPYISIVGDSKEEKISCNIENETNDELGARYAAIQHYINMKIEGYQSFKI